FLRESSPERLRIFSSPTCVGLRYGRLSDSLEGFLGSLGSARLWPEGLPIIFQGWCSDGFACQSPLRTWTRTTNRGRCLPYCVTPSVIAPLRRYRNINLLPFAYASRPRLRTD